MQPWRIHVPTQSFPVSPPPITITFLSLADIYFPSPKLESSRLFVVDFKKSTAKYIPLASLPGALISLGFEAPHARITASYSSISFLALIFSPIFASVTNSTPSSLITSSFLSIICFSSFILGIPYLNSPPILSDLSNTVTIWPLVLSWSAAASPAGPEPTTAIRFPVLTLGGLGPAQPFSYARSIIAISFSLVHTASPFRPQVHAFSHSAGQTRLVNSGKLLVL